jgi:hypothetical protein
MQQESGHTQAVRERFLLQNVMSLFYFCNWKQGNHMSYEIADLVWQKQEISVSV